MNLSDLTTRGILSEETLWDLTAYVTDFINIYTVSLAEYIISFLYGIYKRFTFLNVVIILLKYVPLTIYVYTSLKSQFKASKARIKQKDIELKDIQLQIQIVDNKLCVREAEFSERQKDLRRVAERLRRVRAEVRAIIAEDETLRRILGNFNLAESANDFEMHSTPKEQDFIMEPIKELKCDQVAIPERQSEGMDCGETLQHKSNAEVNNVYHMFDDGDVRHDCRLKIIKVTNVYKVACLKHYIKQKRLRRANKQMMFKKKMESVKKLLEDWQKALNMVINSKLTILNIDGASQEAMGDYTKPRESSDTDSDLRNSSSDACYDEYNLSWVQNPYRPYSYNYEDMPEATVSRGCDYQDYDNINYSIQADDDPIYHHRCPNMVSIIEETNSQMEIEQIKSDIDSDNYHYDEE